MLKGSGCLADNDGMAKENSPLDTYWQQKVFNQ
jgi:hypothetical protein